MNNEYTGRKLALWMLGAVAMLKGLMGLMCIFGGYAVAMRIDGIRSIPWSWPGCSPA